MSADKIGSKCLQHTDKMYGQAILSNNHKIRVEITCMTGHNMHSYAEWQGTMDDSQNHTTGYRDMN